MRLRSVLLPAALLVVAAAFFLLTNSETNAQAESSTALDAPVVTASATGAGAVELSWEAVSGAAGYAVYAWWGENPGWVRLDDGGVAGTSYTHGGPVPGRTYWYSVCAVDGNGDQGACSERPFPSATVSATDAATASGNADGNGNVHAGGVRDGNVYSYGDLDLCARGDGDGGFRAVCAGIDGCGRRPGGIALTWNAVAGAVRYELWTWWDAGVGWQAIGGGQPDGDDVHARGRRRGEDLPLLDSRVEWCG